MPELFSRMDNLNWLTPSIADILDQGSTPPGGDGSIRERMLLIQHELDELDTPARIINVRSTPSYTLYIARPGNIGRMGNRRAVSANEIKQSIKQIAENHKDWLLGFIPQLREDDSSVGILLRTDEHRPLSLRRLMVRSTFRKHPSTLAFVLGVTLDQQLLVNSIDEIGNLLIVGKENAKQHFIRSALLSFIMLNTPSELRVAIAGESSEAYKYLVGAPHALGRILTSPQEGQRLIEGLVKEIQRRRQTFDDTSATDIAHYNTIANQTGKPELPRIILILDSLTDEAWKEEIANWIKPVSELLVRGSKVGIHLLVTVDEEDNLNLSSEALEAITVKIVTRASSRDISSQIPNFHTSLLRFIDAFIIGKSDSDEHDITPVELCAISNSEIKNVVEYWRQMSKQRYHDLQTAKASQSTGVTSVLTALPNTDTQKISMPTPPTPQKPNISTLTRATHMLGTQIAQTVQVKSKPQAVEGAMIETEIIDIPNTSNKSIEALDDTLAPDDNGTLLQQSIALSAYLGWISRGALRDIFNISEQEAGDLIIQLQKQLVVEQGEQSVLRFIRIDKNES